MTMFESRQSGVTENPYLGFLFRCYSSALFIAGEFDGVVTINRQAFDSLEETMPGLRKKVLLPGAGHWIHQERPIEVNDLLIEFLASL
jgi:pimeloyl-ACP methyl ester carboxylesterase